MKWWKVVLVVFLIGIVAALGYWLWGRKAEGFQTPPTTVANINVDQEEQVYLIYPTGQEGNLLKNDAIQLCRRLGGELATTGQLMEAVQSGARWDKVGWTLESGFGWVPRDEIYDNLSSYSDYVNNGGNISWGVSARNTIQKMIWCSGTTDSPYSGWYPISKWLWTPPSNKTTAQSYNVNSGINVCGGNIRYTKSFFPYDIQTLRANAICYGLKPAQNTPNYTIVNFNSSTYSQKKSNNVPKQTLPSTYTLLPIDVNSLPIFSTSDTNNYKMFDIAPIYAQMDISLLEFAKFREEIKQSEGIITTRMNSSSTSISLVDEDTRRFWFAYWFNPWVDNTRLETKSNREFIKFINSMGSRVDNKFDISAFSAHPVGYILSGEKSRPTGVNCAPIFVKNLPNGDLSINNVNQNGRVGRGYDLCIMNSKYAGFQVNNVYVDATNFFIRIYDLLVPFGQIDLAWPTFDSQGKTTYISGNVANKEIIKNPASYGNNKDIDSVVLQGFLSDVDSLKLWNLNSIYNYLRSPIDGEIIPGGYKPWSCIDSEYRNTPYPSKIIMNTSAGTIGVEPSNIEQNKCFYSPNEVSQISNLGILNSQTWLPVLQRSDAVGQPALNAWNATLAAKGGQAFWKPLPNLRGSLSETNKIEMNKSISYSIYFNFSDTLTTERQLRISSDPPYNLCFSPVFRAMNEFFYKVSTKKVDNKDTQYIYFGVDPYAKSMNDTYARVEVTQDFIKYLPYPLADYIAQWGDSRYNRTKAYMEQVSTIGRETRYRNMIANTRPVFDMMMTISTTTDTGFTLTQKRAVLDKIAQYYYENPPVSGANTVIKQFFDCYQVGDTLFDVRYQIQEKTRPEFRDAIRTLTSEYNTLRASPMSIVDLANLEIIYQQNVAELYKNEDRNITGYGQKCSSATDVRYILIKPTNVDKYMYISQVIAVNNYGENVARFSQVSARVDSNGIVSATLFPGEELNPLDPHYTTSGVPLTSDQNATYCEKMNVKLRQDKLNRVVDGILRPRPPPNIYKSAGAGTSEFLLIRLAGNEQIVAVKLVLPGVDYTDMETEFTIQLFDENNTRQIGEVKRVTKQATSRITTTVDYLLSIVDRNKNKEYNCPSDLYNRYRTARFFAEITNDGTNGRTNGKPDVNKITFRGYSESEDMLETAALTFNPRYNGGFDFAIDDTYGNAMYQPKTVFTKNFSNVELGTILNCSNTTDVRNIFADYRLNQFTADFKERSDIKAMVGSSEEYTTDSSFFYPSSVTKYAQLNPSTCAFVYKEIKVDQVSNQFQGLIDRYAIFKMKPDTENWYSQKVFYDTKSSLQFRSERGMTDAMGATSLTALNPPITVPIPLQPRISLANGNGVCPEKHCGDIDVINSLVGGYNNSTINGRARPIQILRVNRAVTVSNDRCDYEVILGDYTNVDIDTPETTFTSTVALYAQLNGDCSYSLKRQQLGGAFTVDGNTPLLAKVYTYASDFLDPLYKSLYTSISSVQRVAAAQLDTTKQTIAQTLGIYRTDVLSAYGALKQLDGCSNSDWSTLKDRCYNSETVNQFIQAYNANPAFSGRLKQVLRAATASGTECDFTFETEDLQVQAGGTVAGSQSYTRGMRCRMTKDPNNCSFTIDGDTPYATEEVYKVTKSDGTGYTYDAAAMRCRELGGRLATYNDLNHAARMGAAWTGGGWVVDSEGASVSTLGRMGLATKVYTPSTEELLYWSTQSFFDSPVRTQLSSPALCVGMKPAQAAGFTPFNATNYKMPIPSYGSCTPFTPFPPTKEDLADLGWRPTTAGPSATVSTMSTTMGFGKQMVSLNPVSPIDFIDCTSQYALRDAWNQAGTTVTSVENKDPYTCIVNNTIGLRYTKQNGVYTYAGRDTGPITSVPANRKTVNVTTAPNLNLTTPIANDAACRTRNDLLDALSSINLTSVDAKQVNINTCEYRTTARDDVAFQNTFRRVQFYQESQTSVGIQSIQPASPADSPYRYQFDGQPLSNLLTNTRFQTMISSLTKPYWNTRNDTSVTPRDITVRDADGRISTIGTYRQRMGAIQKMGYKASEDALILETKFATIGPLNDMYDIRSYTESQQFKILLRSTITGANIFSMTKDSGNTGLTSVAAADTDANVKTITQFLTPPAGSSMPKFRMVRLRVATPQVSEISRINFYKIDPADTPASVAFTCPAVNSDGTMQQAAAAPIQAFSIPTKTTVSITDYDDRALLQPSYYLQGDTTCPATYTQGLDLYTRFSTCTLDWRRLAAKNQPLYSYAKPSEASCQIGYEPNTTNPNATQCELNYTFKDLIGDGTNGSYCRLPMATAIKRTKLSPSQSVIIDFGDDVDFNAISITSGAATRLPTSISVDISVSGVSDQWVNVIATSVTLDLTAQLQTSPIIRFFNYTKNQTTRTSSQLAPGQIVKEAFQVPQQPAPLLRQPAAEPRPSWLRVTVLEMRDPASRYATMGALSFHTPAQEYLDTRTIKVTNFGGSRKSARDGPDALLDHGSGRLWVDYNRAPLLFRFPEERPPIGGFRYATPGTLEGNGALPKRFRLEGSWDGRIWTPLEEDTRVPPNYTGVHAFCRLLKPF
jgi:hypothetical protein